MKKTNYLFLLCLFCLAGTGIFAQDNPDIKKNLIKLNLPALGFKMFTVQYERVLAGKSSVALTLSVSPNASLPFKKTLMDAFSDNEDAKKAIESTLYTRYTANLEYRLYLSKQGAPKGFYIAPFVRYMQMELNQDYPFTPSDGTQHIANLKSKFNAFGGGLMFGAQWMLGEHMALDWWIIGGFYGSNINADFAGTDPKMNTMTQQDRDALENDIESFDIPGYTIQASVPPVGSASNTITAKMEGPYYGIRGFGLCLAYRF